MIREAAVSLLSKTPLTRPLLAWARSRYLRYQRTRFDTCSPDAVPALEEAFELTKEMTGDYYEFGIFKGYLFFRAYRAGRTADRAGIQETRFFGFDSFEGLSAPEGVDAGWRFQKGAYRSQYEKVTRELSRRGVRVGENAFLIKRFYSDVLGDEDALAAYPFGKARVVTVDCDLYSSTRDALSFIGSYLQVGTVVLMDDWNCFDADEDRGQRLALREFLREHPGVEVEQVDEFGCHGAVFIVRALPS